MPTHNQLSNALAIRFRPSRTKPEPECPKCNDRGYFFIPGGVGKRIPQRCDCLSAKLTDIFLSKIPFTAVSSFRSSKFESLSPLKRSLLIQGNQSIARAMIRGTLREWVDRIDYDVLDPVELTGSYVGDQQRPLLNTVINLDLLIVPMRTCLGSEKTGQAVVSIVEARHDKGKPSWFLLSELSPHIKGNYVGPFLDLLLLRSVNGYHLESFECGPATAQDLQSHGTTVADTINPMQKHPARQQPYRIFQMR